ncbi:MAG TPA: YetF domain-containing protein [Saprospiraceae bacterium]
MEENFYAFDWKRIFIGDAPILFLAEIVLRTIIMYSYTTFLLRVLGKRGIGQLSSLELAIIIGFGSAVGDPMIYDDIPVTYGMVAVTVITFLQIGLENFINSNKKAEMLMDGEPNLVIDDGILMHENMKNDNLSREDLFRFLRLKNVTHLGEVSKAFFETSGDLSVMFKTAEHVKPGLSVLPDNSIDKTIVGSNENIIEPGVYLCRQCGHSSFLHKEEVINHCEKCHGDSWIKV